MAAQYTGMIVTGVVAGLCAGGVTASVLFYILKVMVTTHFCNERHGNLVEKHERHSRDLRKLKRANGLILAKLYGTAIKVKGCDHSDETLIVDTINEELNGEDD